MIRFTLCNYLLISALLLIMGSSPVLALEPPALQHGTQHAPAVPQQNIIKLQRNLPPHALQGRPDTDLVELSSGKRMKVGDIRRITAIANKNRITAPKSLEPRAVTLRPAATGGIALRSKADVNNALQQRQDSETVVLPSGRRTTVAMLKMVQPQVEEQRKQLRQSIVPRPNLSGPATRVTADSDWVAILKQPDNTILESARGKRITVGELKQSLSRSLKQPAATPQIR
jgi:hypothetical protein